MSNLFKKLLSCLVLLLLGGGIYQVNRSTIVASNDKNIIKLKVETALFESAAFGEDKYADGAGNLIALSWGRMTPHIIQREKDVWAVVWEPMKNPLHTFVYNYQQRFFKDWKWVETTPIVQAEREEWNYQPSSLFYDKTRDMLHFGHAMREYGGSRSVFQNWVIDPNIGMGELKDELRVNESINYCGGGIGPDGTIVIAGWCSTEGEVLKYVVIRPDTQRVEGPYTVNPGGIEFPRPPLYTHVMVDDEGNYHMVITYGRSNRAPGEGSRYYAAIYLQGKLGEEASLTKTLFTREDVEPYELVWCEKVEFSDDNFHALVRHIPPDGNHRLYWIRFDGSGKVDEPIVLNELVKENVPGWRNTDILTRGDLAMTKDGLVFFLTCDDRKTAYVLLIDPITTKVIGQGSYYNRDPYGFWGIELAKNVSGSIPRSGEVYGMYVGDIQPPGKAPAQTQYYRIRVSWDKREE